MSTTTLTPDEVKDWLDANERPIAWLARQIGSHPAFLGQVLSGKQKYTPRMAARIAKVIR